MSQLFSFFLHGKYLELSVSKNLKSLRGGRCCLIFFIGLYSL
jgi:hypothetical protein